MIINIHQIIIKILFWELEETIRWYSTIIGKDIEWGIGEFKAMGNFG